MKGTQVYTDKNNQLVKGLLDTNSHRPYLNGFVNHLKLTKSELTTYNYLRHIIDFCNSVDKDVSEINYDDYICYENKYSSCSSSYKIVKHSALKAFSEYLFITGMNKINSLENVKAPKATQSVEAIEKRENNYLDPEEVHKLLRIVNVGTGNSNARHKQAVWRTRDKAIIYTLLATGMRSSALYKLDVDDVNFVTGEIMVKEKGKVQLHILDADTLDIIKDWLIDREKFLDGKEEPALFISNRRTRITQQAISNLTQKYGENVKDIHLTPHKLRATFGTQVYAATGDLYLTKEAMGHSNTRTTEIYIRGQRKASKEKARGVMHNVMYGAI